MMMMMMKTYIFTFTFAWASAPPPSTRLRAPMLTAQIDGQIGLVLGTVELTSFEQCLKTAGSRAIMYFCVGCSLNANFMKYCIQLHVPILHYFFIFATVLQGGGAQASHGGGGGNALVLGS